MCSTKKSGIFGISGVSSDFRDLDTASGEGNERAKVAVEAFSYHVAKYVGAYAAAMNGVDVVAFTAGAGENDGGCPGAGMLLSRLSVIKLDKEKNNCRGVERIISTDVQSGLP